MLLLARFGLAAAIVSSEGEWIQGLACEATEPTWHRTPEPEVFCPS
jgi:hypothetical protein